jgi:hypothetical protein
MAGGLATLFSGWSGRGGRLALAASGEHEEREQEWEEYRGVPHRNLLYLA